MSAGAFEPSQYETNNGDIVGITVQPETLTFTAGGQVNQAAPGSISQGFPSAKVSGGRATIGINARLVRFKFSGAPPSGYKPDGVLTIPVLTQAAYNAYGNKATGTYDVGGASQAIIVLGRTPEKIR